MENYNKLKQTIQEANPDRIALNKKLDENNCSPELIRLADVLLAISESGNGFYGVSDGGAFFKVNEDLDTERIYEAGWNLKDDNLDNQTKETIELLIRLLVKEK